MPCPKNLFRGGEGRKPGERAGGGGRGEKFKFYFKHILNPTKHNSFQLSLLLFFSI
jgi:hypothetical protein